MRNSISIISLAILLTFFAGCRSKNSLRKILESECFWDLLDKRDTEAPNSGYRLKKNEECRFFYYKFRYGKKTDTVVFSKDDDVIYPNTWHPEGDTLININGFDMRVLRYNEDSIFLRLFNLANDTIILIRNCKTVSKSGYF